MSDSLLKKKSIDPSGTAGQSDSQARLKQTLRAFWANRANQDLVIITILMIFVFIFSRAFNIFELIVRNVDNGEKWNLDEVLVVVGFLGLAFTFFSIRRWRELQAEVDTHRATQERLRRSEHNYHEMFRNTLDGQVILSPKDMTILEANPQACKIYGYTQEEFSALSLLSLSKEPDSERDGLKSALQNHQPYRTSHLRKDGSELVTEISVSVIDYEGQEAWLSVHRDVDQSAAYERELRESEERYRSLTETALDIIFTIEPDGRVTFINNYGASQINSTPEQVIGKKAGELLPIAAIDEHGWMFRQVFNSGEPLAVESRIPLFDRSIWVNTHLIPLKNDRGQVQAILGYARDVTENKRSFEALQRRDSILQAVGTTTERFLQISADGYRTPLAEILESLGEAAEAEHAYFIELLDLESSEPVLDFIAEWHRPGSSVHTPDAAHNQFKKPAGFEGWVAALKSGRPVQGLAAHFPVEEAQLLEAFGIGSIVIMPIFVNNTLWGLLGLDNCLDETEECPPALLDAFKTAAGAMGAAVQRVHAEREIKRQLARMAALREIDVAILGSVDLTITLNLLLSKAIELLDMDAATILLYNRDFMTLEYTAGIGFRTNALKYTRLKLGEGYAGLAGLNQQVIHIDDLRNRGTDLLRSPYFAQEEFVVYYAIPLIAKGQMMGVMEVFSRTPERQAGKDYQFIESVAGQAAIAIDNSKLFEEQQHANLELRMAYDDTLVGWSRALEYRDDDTEGHTQRVTDLAQRLGRAMNLSDQDMVVLYRGSLLHDIGKIGIPDAILLKPGPLTDQEWEIMRLHPVYAYEMLKQIPFLKSSLDIPYCHHEKWDGSGYPRGLKENAIPLTARIFAVVDVWDALTSDRPYRSAWPKAKVLQYIREQSGKHFDPKIVEKFLEFSLRM